MYPGFWQHNLNPVSGNTIGFVARGNVERGAEGHSPEFAANPSEQSF